MKTKLTLLALPLLFAACSQNAKTTANVENMDSAVADTFYFEGTVPAADGPGIKYEIALANDSTNGFSLSSTYLAEEGKEETFRRTGVAEVLKKTVDGKEATFYRFPANDGVSDDIFKCVDDSTLRMVNAEFKEAGNPADYDLKKK